MLRRATSDIAQRQIDEVAAGLVGSRLQSLTKEKYLWLLVFTSDTSVRTRSAWRLVGPDRTFVTSEGHGHWFGLAAPVDAAEWVTSALGDAAVTAVGVPYVEGDLLISFGERFELQLLQMSSGYESWHVHAAGSEIICYGGGKLD